MDNETEGREIEVVESKTEGVDKKNEEVNNEVIPFERKGYCLQNILSTN